MASISLELGFTACVRTQKPKMTTPFIACHQIRAKIAANDFTGVELRIVSDQSSRTFAGRTGRQMSHLGLTAPLDDVVQQCDDLNICNLPSRLVIFGDGLTEPYLVIDGIGY